MTSSGATSTLDIAAASTLLSVRDLRVAFPSPSGTLDAVRDVSLDLPPSGTLVLLGESGSGKTATVLAIAGLHARGTRVSGSIRLGDRELIGASDGALRELRGRRIGYVGQDPAGGLDPLRRVGAQLVEVLRAHRVITERRAARRRAVELLALVGLQDAPRVAASFPHELSGGMQQRATIALAIAGEPDLLIADEPTTALDVTVQVQILKLLKKLQRNERMAILMVTHDLTVARALGGEMAVMYAGRVVESGSTDRLLRDPQHPYTVGLISAVPSRGIERGKLAVIPGGAPRLDEIPAAGCAFAPRCRLRERDCLQSRPALRTVSEGRQAACHVVARSGEGTLEISSERVGEPW